MRNVSNGMVGKAEYCEVNGRPRDASKRRISLKKYEVQRGPPLKRANIKLLRIALMCLRNKQTCVHFWDSWADETRRERVDAYERNRTTLRTGE